MLCRCIDVDSGPVVTLLGLVRMVLCASGVKNGRVLLGTIGTLVGVLMCSFLPTNDPIAPLLNERHDLIIRWLPGVSW